jgi:ABC-2 type transport system permease protein
MEEPREILEKPPGRDRQPRSDFPSPRLPVSPSPARPASAVRSWFYLVWLSIQRQARARQMVWISLGLLLLTMVVVWINTAQDRWGMNHWRSPHGRGPTLPQWLLVWQTTSWRAAVPDPVAGGITDGVVAACRAIIETSGFYVFSRFLVFSVFISFLLPLWSLSFATEALAGEREERTLIWLLMRPWPRPALYLAKYAALLPWCLGFNLIGFAAICLVAGPAGWTALELYWPAVLGATLAFSALFHLMGALFRRAALMAIVYSFFLETILGNMPGYMKRVSIGFYTRCLMFDAAQDYGVQPDNPAVFLPVDAMTAWAVLLGVTVVLLAVGMWLFSRTEYGDDS